MDTVMERIEALGKISDEKGKLTRTLCSPAMRQANDLVASWMREAGMEVREDAIGNLIGHYPAAESPKSKRSEKGRSLESTVRQSQGSGARESKILLLGSHLDTVRDAGKFDGALGVVVAIACVQHLHASRTKLPFAIEVIGFADEEGVRYESTYLGSKVLSGRFNAEDLKRTDANGVTMADAIRNFGGDPDALGAGAVDRNKMLGYLEVHIEQGPVLEEQNLALGVVSAIAGQSRYEFRFFGRAGHAGTVPMNLRADALCAAAEFILAVEAYAKNSPGLVATVGTIAALPGASNVIPGEVSLTIDVRHADDDLRKKACASLHQSAADISSDRTVDMKWALLHQASSVSCDTRFSTMLESIVKKRQGQSVVLPSGAGHDAAAMAAITPIAMLFVRCKGGISHHPEEFASEKDFHMAIEVMNDFLRDLAGGFKSIA